MTSFKPVFPSFWQAHRRWLIPLLLTLVIWIFSRNKDWVEQVYSNGFYPVWGRIQRFLLGWQPLSIGDILYSVLVIWLVVHLVSILKNRSWHKWGLGGTRRRLGKVLIVFMWIYVVFQLSWGLNYQRHGIAWHLGLDVKTYTTGELDTLTGLIIQRLAVDADTTEARYSLRKRKILYDEGQYAYDILKKVYPFLAHPRPVSTKTSLFGWLGNYVGFQGYYNPFSGEAQVNRQVPYFLQPNIVCHELAHQVGYAKENEANFVGYLAGKYSRQKQMRYSAYFDLFQYAIRELSFRDTALARARYKELPLQTVRDLAEWRRFQLKHRNPLEKIVMYFYGHYLRVNNQPKGLGSYNEVIAWLMAYYRKFGAEAI
jgi:hypothetical protein